MKLDSKGQRSTEYFLGIRAGTRGELEAHYRHSKENVPTKASSFPSVMKKDFLRWVGIFGFGFVFWGFFV